MVLTYFLWEARVLGFLTFKEKKIIREGFRFGKERQNQIIQIQMFYFVKKIFKGPIFRMLQTSPPLK